MIKLDVDEAYAFDYFSIFQLKGEYGYVTQEVIKGIEANIINQIGKVKFLLIISSDEYKDLYNANKLTFEAVDKAKEDEVLASYVDSCNFTRMIAKKALQSEFFETELTETKIGYDRLKS